MPIPFEASIFLFDLMDLIISEAGGYNDRSLTKIEQIMCVRTNSTSDLFVKITFDTYVGPLVT